MYRNPVKTVFVHTKIHVILFVFVLNSLNYKRFCAQKFTEFIPKFDQLSKKRQFEILIFRYDPDNKELDRTHTKIMYLTQNFIYDTKRFISPV